MAQSPSLEAQQTPRRSSPLLVVIAWMIVGVPAVWGVSQTAMQAAALFRPAPPAPAVEPSPATTPATNRS